MQKSSHNHRRAEQSSGGSLQLEAKNSSGQRQKTVALRGKTKLTRAAHKD
jgi:hypothetical protein